MLKEVRDELNFFAKYIVQQSRSNLTKGASPYGSFNASGSLYRSIKSDIQENQDTASISFLMEDYGKFRDKGVSGKRVKYQTPYSYKNAMPPPSKLDKWIVRRGLAPRQNGRFTGRKIDTVGFRKSIQFLVARSIYFKGIKPSLFFTKPFERAFKRLPEEIVKAYSIGIENQIKVNIEKK